MEQYVIWEGFMEDLEKKVKTIKKKCERFGCEFHFEKVGEEIRTVYDYTNCDPVTGKPTAVNCKFIICEAEGTAKINGWSFVANVEHTEKGNIFSKALTNVEIPERYRCSDPYCEHCNTHRHRKGTFIIMNSETGEFKQVGHNCLMDYTHGMSASWAAYMASLRTVFEEYEEKIDGGWSGSWSQRYFDTKEILTFTAEIVRKFGFVKNSDGIYSTKDRVCDWFNVWNGNTRYWTAKDIDAVKREMEDVNFNPDSLEAHRMADDALAWLEKQEEKNDYMHNLKVVASLDYTTYSRFGILVSLFPTWNKDLERVEKQKQEKVSEFVGSVGDKILVAVDSVKCVTSWSSFFGYSEKETYIYKIVGKDGNIYTWKTSTWIDEERCPVEIKGTVKDHNVYRDVKQTELTRCRITKPWVKPVTEIKHDAPERNAFDEAYELFENAELA